MTENIIETFDLTKIYKLKGKEKHITALNKVNISIKEGDIFGLLGPNGAGKTTMIHIFTTILQPTSGRVLIDGYDVVKKSKEVKSRMALMLESQMLYYRLTGYNNLKFFCQIYNVPNYKAKIRQGAEEFGLNNWLNEYVEKYSSGMKVKLALLRTLLLNRKILVLDEPTIGMDAKIKSFVVEKLKESNKTVFITSHDMSLIEKLCNRVAFINNGSILKIGTKDDLKTLMQTEIKIEVEIRDKKDEFKSELESQSFIIDISNKKNGLIISLKERDHYNDLFPIFNHYHILKVKEQELSLEDLFLKLI